VERRWETLGDAGENLSQDSQLHLGGELRRVHTPGATTGPIAIHAGFLNTSETLASTTTDNTHPPDRPHCPLLDAQPTTPQYRNTAIPLPPVAQAPPLRAPNGRPTATPIGQPRTPHMSDRPNRTTLCSRAGARLTSKIPPSRTPNPPRLQ
jgi:hypothetical protein